MVKKFDVKKHVLVPEHKKLTDKQKKEVLKSYGVTVNQLPKILSSDPALANIDVKQGDVVMVKRQSPTIGESVYYRGVVDE
ncbi:MAG: DNA-directed RNA polymerase subunit H [Nanobdellota archaeon]